MQRKGMCYIVNKLNGFDFSNTTQQFQGLAQQIRENEDERDRALQSVQKREKIRDLRAEASKNAAVETAAELKALREAMQAESEKRNNADKRTLKLSVIGSLSWR